MTRRVIPRIDEVLPEHQGNLSENARKRHADIARTLEQVMNYSFWGATDLGRNRKVNEDAFLLVPELGLVAVADGMGGADRGDVASTLACNVIKERIGEEREILENYRRMPTPARREMVRQLLERAFQQACEEVHRAARMVASEGRLVGTTMDAALFCGHSAFTAHVGDGRIYLYRDGETHQLTEEHAIIEEQIREGILTVDEARKSRMRHVVTRALGVFPNVRVDTLHLDMGVGDCLLICTDGLHRYLRSKELEAILATAPQEDLPRRLADTALERGCKDNVTVALVRVDKATEEQTGSAGREMTEVLRTVDIFRYCTYRELVQIRSMSTERTIPAHTEIFHEGDRGDELFLLIKGRVEVLKEGSVLASLQPPQSFGEMSFIDRPYRSASIRTVDESTFLIIGRDQFLQMMKKDSELAAKVSWQLNVKLTRLVRESSSRAVAETLILED